MTPNALTGRTDPSGAENARRKARILEGAIQQRNTGIRNKLNALADRARELESKLKKKWQRRRCRHAEEKRSLFSTRSLSYLVLPPNDTLLSPIGLSIS